MENSDLTQKLSRSFRNTQAGYCAEYIPPVHGMTSLADVFSLIDDPEKMQSIPVEENGGVTGLVRVATLLQKKGSLLHSLKNATIGTYIEEDTATVDAMENIDVVLRQLLARKNWADDFIVTHCGRYLGTGSLLRLLKLISDLREEDLSKARNIQRHLMRNILDAKSGIDVKTMLKTAHKLGGDYYIAVTLRDGLSLVACFDVSGKNVSASLTTGMLSAFFSTAMMSGSISSLTPSEIVLLLNGVTGDQTPMGVYITGVMLFVDTENREIEYFNLGHTPVYLLSHPADGENGLRILESNFIPLGIDELGDIKKSVKKIPMEQGLKVITYSDGLIEARDSAGRMFGDEKLREFLVSVYDDSPSVIITKLDDEILRFTESAVLFDDITALVMEVQ